MTQRENGIVKWYNTGKGYGFITGADSGDLFVHFSALQDADGEGLQVGQHVEFDVVETERGPMADAVSLTP